MGFFSREKSCGELKNWKVVLSKVVSTPGNRWVFILASFSLFSFFRRSSSVIPSFLLLLSLSLSSFRFRNGTLFPRLTPSLSFSLSSSRSYARFPPSLFSPILLSFFSRVLTPTATTFLSLHPSISFRGNSRCDH